MGKPLDLRVYLGKLVKVKRFHEPIEVVAVESTPKTLVFKGADSTGRFQSVSAYFTDDLVVDGKAYTARAWPHQTGQTPAPFYP